MKAPEEGHSDDLAVDFTSVAKWFRRGDQSLVHALSNINLGVSRGEFVSLIGPSGCGKSTLLRLAGGLLEPERGEIIVEGSTPLEARRKKRYGFVPQQPALLPWKTVRENTSILPKINKRSESPGMSEEDQLAMLEQIGLGPFVDSYPRELSGGMQQRVAIARAFATAAPVLLMDEPFSALDEITRGDMRYLLLELWERQRTTVIFVTHSIPEAVILSDRVVALGARPGRITNIIDVPIERPRREDVEDSEMFHGLVAEVRSALKEGWSN